MVYFGPCIGGSGSFLWAAFVLAAVAWCLMMEFVRLVILPVGVRSAVLGDTQVFAP